MKIFLLLAIGLLGVAALYYFGGEQLQLQESVTTQQNAAQEATDAYRENQQRMMEQLEQ